jgi:predicted enzyme related to lactoylglutathione lyase
MMGTMKIDNALASIAVKDLKTASAWYERLFRRPADSTPVPELAERAGGGSCTLAVSDIAGVTAHLQSLGIDTSEANSGKMAKTVMITDPDGNHLAFAEAIAPGLAR